MERLSAFITYGHGLFRWWNDVATEARGRGFDASNLIELGTRAAWVPEGVGRLVRTGPTMAQRQMERLDRVVELLEALCGVAGVPTRSQQEDPRAFITTDEGRWWWDVEEAKSRAAGLDTLSMFELGAKVTFFLEGRLVVREVEVSDEEPYVGQYL